MSFGSVKFCRWQLPEYAITILALNILDARFIGMYISIAYGFGARMAIDAIQFIHAFGKLCDGLIFLNL